MNTGTRCTTWLLLSGLLLLTAGTAWAGPLFPLHVGQVCQYNRYDTDDLVGWPVTLEIDSQATFDLLDYFHVQSWNYDNDGQVEDGGYVRSTEQALYGYNPTGEDYVLFQAAPVGTRWSIPEPHNSYNYRVSEIVAIESVTVPYGTFNQAYKHRNYLCVDPDNLGLGKSPDWYEWVVPGMGIVKEEDYWNDYPPAIQELVGLALAPVYRFWKAADGTHFYTVKESEKNKLINSYSHIYTYEGPVYYAYPEGQQPAEARPVYRFWKAAGGTHFYTMKDSEKDKLINSYSDIYTYEGPVFYAYAEGEQPAETQAVYRFWKEQGNTHFYTIKESEKNKLINNYSHIYTHEGPVWYAYE